MNCIQCKEYLLEYAEGTLSASLQKQVKEHIDSCPACAQEAALFAQMTDILQDMPEVDLPDGYHTELMQKIQKEAKTVLPFPTAKRRNWKNIGLIAAAVVLIAAAGGVQGIQKLRTAQDAVVAETTQPRTVSENMTQEQEATTPQMANTVTQPSISETTQTPEQNMDTTTQDIATPETSTQPSKDVTSVTNHNPTEQSNITSQEATPKEATPQETLSQENVPQEASSQPQGVTTEESQMVAQPQMAQETPTSGGGAEIASANAGISVMRSAQNESDPAYQATLVVTDIGQSLQAVRESMLDLGGTEQTSTENSVTFTVAVEKIDNVFTKLRQIGTLQEPEIAQTQQDTITLTILLQQE